LGDLDLMALDRCFAVRALQARASEEQLIHGTREDVITAGESQPVVDTAPCKPSTAQTSGAGETPSRR
jgi:hypothetical protein